MCHRLMIVVAMLLSIPALSNAKEYWNVSGKIVALMDVNNGDDKLSFRLKLDSDPTQFIRLWVSDPVLKTIVFNAYQTRETVRVGWDDSVASGWKYNWGDGDVFTCLRIHTVNW